MYDPKGANRPKIEAMSDKITRREFVDGIACAVLAGTSLGARATAPSAIAYPPSLTGFRGSRDSDLAVAHALRDGAPYRMDEHPIAGDVDCAVVGAGIGGLSAAYFVSQGVPGARVLILDNHDDFGGHARRNEFQVDGRLLIGYGGSESIQSPKSQWSRTARDLLSDLGVHPQRFERAIDTNLYPRLGMSSGLLFAREHFGVDRLVTGDPQRTLPTDIPAALHRGRPVAEFWADAPLTGPQRQTLVELYTARRDLFPGRSRREKLQLLDRISYAEFLVRYWNLDSTALKIFLGRTRDLFALSGDLVPASWAAGCDLPGFRGLDLGPELDANYEHEPYIHHFPDGNASLARLLVRRLVPRAASGASMEDIVTSPLFYAELDRPSNPVRLRLSSTVVQLRNTASHVEVLYAGQAGVRRIRCRRLIYAGYAAMLPHLCEKVPAAQSRALSNCVRSPLVYVTVALRNWHPWVRAGVHHIVNPTGFYSVMKLDYPVSLGRYRFARSPDEPILLHLSHIPQPPAPIADRRSSVRAARQVLYARPFSDFEDALRDEVNRAVEQAGFEFDADVAAITVNRWGHGYAYDLNPLSDPEGAEAYPADARRAIGRISIGSSDTAWEAYAHAAIDEASRAAHETVLGLRS